MNTQRIKEISTELWEITYAKIAEIGTPTQGEKSAILVNCVNMIKYATWIIDEAVEAYEYLTKKESQKL